ncbi:rRNA pseudouridine synthase [Rickettsiales endosymbiont of Peranema trichophorum]|uniref:pseudouridine synthase n=1 Tax=Rickettsiales endosymbiont of Peranema trichophorum TaxID=2486577 RepID=UPI0010239EF9|nr:pseudouridine synthase [Rickettsiales endosymbiont of Peranema trichophorum]RZI47616.1 rRNA pseudouridine synthase [Rickettsiales endosymbiont of Peranema trichophorum]
MSTSTQSPTDIHQKKQERIAKTIARAGVCSRRDAEKLILQGVVTLNGQHVMSPATLVSKSDTILVNNQPLISPMKTRLWLFFKPKGVVTTNRDPKGRKTIFDILPKNLPRVISVGRLDLNSEGLLLLTNSGALSRQMELPSTGLERRYRCRVHGLVHPGIIKKLANGVVVDGIRYDKIIVTCDRLQGTHSWVTVSLHEGKNREIRKAFEYFGLTVNRLIRVGFDRFELGDLKVGEVKEIGTDEVHELLNELQLMDFCFDSNA